MKNMNINKLILIIIFIGFLISKKTAFTFAHPIKTFNLNNNKNTHLFYKVYTGIDFIQFYSSCPKKANAVSGIIYGKASETQIIDGNLTGILGVISNKNCKDTNGIVNLGSEWLEKSTAYNFQIVFFKIGTSYWPPLSAGHFPELNFPSAKVYSEEDYTDELYRGPAFEASTTSVPDSTPPVFTVTDVKVTKHSALITYFSDDYLTGSNYIAYDLNPILDSGGGILINTDELKKIDENNVYRQAYIKKLTPATIYYYRIRGNNMVSSGGVMGYLATLSPNVSFSTK